MERQVVLGSASPRRAELLREAGLSFVIDKPDVDESLPGGIEPAEGALELATRKARVIAQRRRGEHVLVIAADTIVAVTVEGQTRLLGKPADEHEERAMLGWLSGSRHQVVTGVAVIDAYSLALASGFERTWVTMRVLGADEIEAYIASGEWRDKAGGYAIQENADRFVTRIEEGGFDNVVGLPVSLTLRLLAQVTGSHGP